MSDDNAAKANALRSQHLTESKRRATARERARRSIALQRAPRPVPTDSE